MVQWPRVHLHEISPSKINTLRSLHNQILSARDAEIRFETGVQPFDELVRISACCSVADFYYFSFLDIVEQGQEILLAEGGEVDECPKRVDVGWHRQ